MIAGIKATDLDAFPLKKPYVGIFSAMFLAFASHRSSDTRWKTSDPVVSPE